MLSNSSLFGGKMQDIDIRPNLGQTSIIYLKIDLPKKKRGVLYCESKRVSIRKVIN